MKKETLYVRKGKTITGPDGPKTFPSINAAKRESRKLQPQLGDGTVRVEK
jgi:hypothetical protein